MDPTIPVQQPTQQIQTPTPTQLISPSNNKKKIVIIIGILVVIILLFFVLFNFFISKPTYTQPKGSLSPTPIPIPAFAPQTINQKSSSEIYIDIKNQLIKAFK